MDPEDFYWIRIFVERPNENLLAIEFYNMNENQAALLIAMAAKQLKSYEICRMIKDNEWEKLNKFSPNNPLTGAQE